MLCSRPARTAGGHPDALAERATRYRSAALIGISQTRDRPGALARKRHALARRLLNRQDDYLRFTHDFAVAADNNGCERDIRMAKLRQKVSGCLRTLTGARQFCAIRSYRDDTEAVTGRRVALLALAAFVVASDATLVAALLRQIASTLSASLAAAGQPVTAYAAGYALGAPLIIRAARRARQERLLAGSLGVFAAANAATAAAPSLAALLAARIAAGACGGVFMAAAAATAAGSVAPGHRGRALAVIVGGSSAGTAFGVPLGTFAGGAIGWRAAFFGITAVAALAAAATAAFSPHEGSRPPPAPAAIPRGAALAGGLTLTALSLAGLGVIAAAVTGPPALIASGAAIASYGFGTWAITPPQQQRLLSCGGNERLLLSLNASALYAGVGLGGAIGGLTLALSHSTTVVCWTAAGIELAALTLVGQAASRKNLNGRQAPS